MSQSKTVTVTGLDLAAVNSGMCRIEARAAAKGAWPPLEVEVLDHEPIELKRKDPMGRLELAERVAGLPKSSDLVAVEDYVRRVGKTNTTAYECGEFVGPTKAMLNHNGYDVLLVPTTTMRSLLKVPTGKDGKKFIMRWVAVNFGFEPPYGREKQRSDVADAFVHAYIGALYWFLREGIIGREDLSEREIRTFYGHPGPPKSKVFVGVLQRPLTDIFVPANPIDSAEPTS